MKSEDIATEINSWSPELGSKFNTLSYLGSEFSVKWFTDHQQDIVKLIAKNGTSIAIDIWQETLNKRLNPSAPVLLIILEHLRKNPSIAGKLLNDIDRSFIKTLINVSYRAASALYDAAKDSFAHDEIDLAISRFVFAITEFRFSIESDHLTADTKRNATGKYATAVAVIGRWINVAPDTISRALLYSQESMDLGNKTPETLMYRVELILLQFDKTRNSQLLQQGLELLSNNKSIASGTEIAEAEIRFRLALVASSKSREFRRYINSAHRKISSYRPKGAMEDARRSVLFSLISQVLENNLVLAPELVAIPRGLLAFMETKPSTNLWSAIRCVISDLNNQGGVPASVLSARFLRQIVNGPTDLIEKGDFLLYVKKTAWLSNKISNNRHFEWEAGAAALLAAKHDNNQTLALTARSIFINLAQNHATWPLPRIGVARVDDYLDEIKKEESSKSNTTWREAAELALKASDYVKSHLGGRNEVFAVTDARGFLSETFVFKRTTKDKAEYEAQMLSTLQGGIDCSESGNRFQVPRSLAIVSLNSDEERRWVHVTQRATGRLVSDLSPEEAADILESIIDFLAIFHRIAGRPKEGQSAWGSLKGSLKMWAKALFTNEQADSFVQSLHNLYPKDLDLVRKRDGHASNWMIDSVGRIIAIDLESSNFLPIGYDVTQLIEDNALIPSSEEGWARRIELFVRYTQKLDKNISIVEISAAYGWFAITRALRLGTEKEASKKLRRHARELCGMLINYGDSKIRDLAEILSQALSRVEQLNSTTPSPSRDHRGLSKSMACLLRHTGPTSGLAIDSSGFADLDKLAEILGEESNRLLAVVEHPSEPRFQLINNKIRALYGHSINVNIDPSIKVGNPNALYHGSECSALDSIVLQGLLPQSRRMVHLTNNVDEAILVGSRKGSAILFQINQTGAEKPAAEGIWVIDNVPPENLSIINQFMNEVGISR